MSSLISIESLDVLNTLTDKIVNDIFIKPLKIMYDGVAFSTILISQELHANESKLIIILQKTLYIKTTVNDIFGTSKIDPAIIPTANLLDSIIESFYTSYSKELIRKMLHSTSKNDIIGMKEILYVRFTGVSYLRVCIRYNESLVDKTEKVTNFKGANLVVVVLVVVILKQLWN